MNPSLSQTRSSCPKHSHLKQHFGFDAFRPLQEDIIDHVLSGRDAVVLMPTGGGKSLCYQMPAVMQDGVTMVVSPLISLMKDQVDALNANGIPAAFINSSLSGAQIHALQKDALAGRFKLLYIAPERLGVPGFDDFLKRLAVNLWAIDEAHCISEWGHHFRPDYLNLKRLRTDFPDVPIMALTATATPKVRDDIMQQLGLNVPRVFQSSFNRENLRYVVRPKDAAFAELVEELRRQPGEAAIVYCFSRKDTEALAEDLCRHQIPAAAYHAGLSDEDRVRVQDQFIRDEVPVVAATIAFGMGINKPDVRLVAHYDLPKTVESYYQETGRAGRDGLPARCLLFYSYADKMKQDYFIRQMTDEGAREKAAEKLSQMIRYCETPLCRRAYLLDYFGEKWTVENCQGCDICLGTGETFDAGPEARAIIACVGQTGQRFGMNYIIDILRGGKAKRILQYGHDRLTEHGALAGRDSVFLRGVIQTMMAKGWLFQHGDEYPLLGLSDAGKVLLKNDEAIMLPRPRSAAATLSAKSAGKRRERLDPPAHDAALFEELRQLRKDLARERNVPPFVVFPDQTLYEMSAFMPETDEELSNIFGVGEVKREVFGEAFLRSIRDFRSKTGKPKPQQGPARKAENADRGVQPQRESTIHVTARLLEEGKTIAEAARERNITEASILNHLEKLSQIMDPHTYFPHLKPSAERLQTILAAFAQARTIQLSPVRAILGESFSYEELRLARVFGKEADGA